MIRIYTASNKNYLIFLLKILEILCNCVLIHLRHWQTINKLLNRQSKSTTINKIKANGTDAIGDINVTQEFNNYFCSVGPKLANDIPSTDIDPLTYMTPVSTSFEFQDLRIEELRSAMKNLKMSKSPGLDKISVKLLKEAGDTITLSFVLLFDLSLSTGIFPDDWKFAKVTQIYRSGEK